ncbi:MAG: hypothetical protein OJF60_001142 [Burkholderiaceae bacterium]|jgi:8-oxo-dGTP pyrophosphatase MutT (NUDIX family)|nr:MAG: hypothetical protein OJF60_001142 [Burkholderiaceae bacterium]
MELRSEPITEPPRAAATVVLLRDGTAGLEVLLLKRHSRSDVLGGVYVFPGGKVDAIDARPDWPSRLDQSPSQLHAGLHEPGIDDTAATSLYVAALREVFEESGLLLALDLPRQLAARAAALHRDGCAFDDLLARLALTLHTRAALPWSRWITPRRPAMMSKRFDTRFFVAEAPAGQQARHDEHETTESVWLAPRAALLRYHERRIELAPPQIMSLAHLSRHASVASVLQEARSRPPPLVEPEPIEQDGMQMFCYPGDLRHPVRQRALPGPTRLCCQDGRHFEPVEGFDALFG